MEDVGIRLSLAGRRELAAGLQEGEEGFEELGKAAEDAGKKGEQSGRRFDRTRSILGGLGRGLLFGVKAAGAMAVAGAAVGVKTAAGMQTARIGFTTMLGSARKADTFLRDLAGFAAKTPFEFPELQSAASSLVSAGYETKRIIPMMTTLGDVTAGMGTGSEGIKRATNALQQMSAAGKISAEDLNQLRDAGIPVYDLLSAALGKSKAEVAKLKDEGKLGADALFALNRALVTGKGLERFSGLMAEQSKSLTGRWSTLKDTVTMGLAGAVEPAVPIIGRLLNIANRLAVQAMPKIEAGLKSAIPYVRNFLNVLTGKGGGGGGAKEALQSLQAPGVPSSLGAIGTSLGTIGTALEGVDWAAVKDNLGEGLADTVSVGAVAVGFLADHVDTFAKYLPALVVALVAWKVAQAAGNLAAVAAIPITVAQIGANLSLAAAMRAQTRTAAVQSVTTTRSIVTTAGATTATVAQTTATTAAATAQRGLNLAMLASPLGLLVIGIMLVVGAFVLAYKRSDRFREFIDLLWNNVLKPFGEFIGKTFVTYILTLAGAWLRMGSFAVKAFGFLVRAAIWAFDGILSAAEKGLGWVPGLGDKIKGAREAFNTFGDATVAKLDRMETKLKTAADKVDQLARPRPPVTIDITTRYTTVGSPTRGRGGDADIPGVANGGHVQARRPYIIGERRAELFVPSVSGRILPRVPDSPAELDDLGPSGFGEDGGGSWSRGPRIVQLVLDRRVIAEAVLDEVGSQAARR